MRTSWLPAQGGVLRIPVLGGKRSEKKGVGQWKDPQLMVVRLRGRGDARLTKDGRKQGCPAQPGSQTHAPGFPYWEPSCRRCAPQGISKPWKAARASRAHSACV